MITIDGRCPCSACQDRTTSIYRMVGICYNCGATPILMIFRVGDRTADLNCPVCGNKRVHSQRLATEDEIPEDEPVLSCD